MIDNNGPVKKLKPHFLKGIKNESKIYDIKNELNQYTSDSQNNSPAK